MTEARLLSAEELDHVHWKGHAFFDCLGYSFSVRWNRGPVGTAVDHFLHYFSVPKNLFEAKNPPTLGQPDEYSLVDFGSASEATARYKLLSGNRVMNQSPDVAGLFHFLLAYVNGAVFRQAGQFLMIHAGAVATPSGQGVILPGGSGTGKTTLVTGLVQEGFGYLSDEVAAIDPVARRLRPYPQTLILKKGSFKLFPTLRARAGHGAFVSSLWYLRPDDIRPNAVAGPCDIGFVIFARYEKGAAGELESLSKGVAVQELLTATFNLETYGGRALDIVADSVRSAGAYRLTTGDLEQAVQTITSLTCGNRGGSS